MMQVVNGQEIPVSKHTFNKAADTTIDRAAKISNQRAGEYHDSWSVDQLHTPYLDNLLRDFPTAPPVFARQYKRLIVMASMIDIKISRMGGGWKDDTCIDLINYVAAYCQLRNEFNANFEVNAKTERPKPVLDRLPGTYNTAPFPQDMVNAAKNYDSARRADNGPVAPTEFRPERQFQRVD